ncbi:MAG: AcrR family transcriptional regulator [Paracoccaceae bacterium]|jgi:AcrR family transcriptional regulator
MTHPLLARRLDRVHSPDDDDAACGRMKGGQTRALIKRAALTAFAQKGLEGASVREILRIAGQKNAGSINYYFSSRADLIDELIRDVAVLLDRDHAQRVDALEAAGGPHSIRELAVILTEAPTLDGVARDDRSLRFLNMVLQNHRQRLFDAMHGLDGGTRRCLAHMRRLAPPMPEKIVRQRLMLVMIYVVGAASTREAARDDMASWETLWGGALGRETLADTVVGIMTQPPAPETLAQLVAENADRRTRS